MNECDQFEMPSPQGQEDPEGFVSDAAVEQLFKLIQVGFDRRLIFALEQCRGLNLGHAETELRLLDLFAVYLAIRRTDCERWKQRGRVLFEEAGVKVLTAWAEAWGPEDDMVEIVKSRLNGYRAFVEKNEAAADPDLNDVSLLLGISCTLIIRGGRRVFKDDRETFDKEIVQFVDDDSLLCTTGATIFRTRFDAVSQILPTFSN